jgi:glycosyltransferase involved in cell wall biosynthesis
MDWHVITSEYPPQPGGVSDYTRLVANRLAAAGDEVHVWCQSSEDSETSDAKSGAGDSGAVSIHRDFGRFAPADLRRVNNRLDQFPAPRRLLVQWVTQGYGYRSINLPFCLWLWARAKLKHDRVEIMVHEPFLAYGEGSPKQDLAAAAHRLMVTILLKAASRVWVSILDWETKLRPYAGENKSFVWLPVPSTIPVVDDPDGTARVRARYAGDNLQLIGHGHLIGHFGAYDRYLTELMLELLPALLNGQGNLSVLLLGKGSLELQARLVELHPKLSGSVHATGELSAADVSRHVSACDLMLQPYQDGVSGRRTSVMTALAHGVPVVTTEGKATESCWSEGDSVRLSKADDINHLVKTAKLLLADNDERHRLSLTSRAFYDRRFDLKQTIARLREAVVS